jgi:hypothetical protein
MTLKSDIVKKDRKICDLQKKTFPFSAPSDSHNREDGQTVN